MTENTFVPEEPPCFICGAKKQWIECQRCDGIGAYAFEPDGFEEECEECEAMGGYYRCPNYEEHAKAIGF